MSVQTQIRTEDGTMLRSLDDLRGYSIGATDKEIGRVHDIYFSEAGWCTQYFVVDTGSWLPGRKVLISPVAFDHPDWSSKVIPTGLTSEQVKNSPDIDTAKPVSRQQRRDLHRFFGWPMNFRGPALPGTLTPGIDPRVVPETTEALPGGEDGSLRSFNEVKGYRIQATDGDIGHVEDLIVEEDSWAIRYMVVDTRNWLPGRKVLVSPGWIREIDWNTRTVTVDLTREQIRKSPPFDPEQPINRAYEMKLYDYYGRPRYWSS